MNLMKKLILSIILFLSLWIISPQVKAQCSLCQAQVQTNSQEGNHQAAGLNSGILYLMSTPYLIAIGLGVIWYKKYRKKEITLHMKEEPFHLN